VSLRVKWHRRATRDLQSVHERITQDFGAPTAKRVRTELRQSARSLALRPFLLGRSTADPEVRVLSVTLYPYLIYYTVTAVAVVILHIRHSARLDPDLSEIGHLHEEPAVYGAPALPR
jgi:plasmid stabilization system protein ParE